MGNYTLYLIPSGPEVWAWDRTKHAVVTTAQVFVDRLAAHYPVTFEGMGGDPVKVLETPFMANIMRATYKEVVPLYTNLATHIDIDVCGAIRRVLTE